MRKTTRVVVVDIRAWGRHLERPLHLSVHDVVYHCGYGSYQDMGKTTGVGLVAIRTWGRLHWWLW